MISTDKIFNSYLIESDDIEFAKTQIQDFIIKLGFDDTLVKTFNHPDVKYIVDENNLIAVENIREKFVKDIIIRPRIASKKVYIIADVKYMSESTQNAILKTIEEPPEYAIIFLITKNKNSLLDTIKSRCQIISLINENNKYEELKQKEYFIPTLKIVADSAFNTLREIKTYSSTYCKTREDLVTIFYIIRILIRDSLLYIDTLDNSNIILQGEEVYIQSLINKFNKIDLGYFVDYIDEADIELHSNIDTEMIITKLLLLFRKRRSND